MISIWYVMIHSLVYIFFFSSRRRHTRLQGDWSSDVCSSDLQHVIDKASCTRSVPNQRPQAAGEIAFTLECTVSVYALLPEIGRASCRVRVRIVGCVTVFNDKMTASKKQRGSRQ